MKRISALLGLALLSLLLPALQSHADGLIKRADDLLYEAKRRGRDQVVAGEAATRDLELEVDDFDDGQAP